MGISPGDFFVIGQVRVETWTLNTTIDELVDDGLQVGGLELGKRSDGFPQMGWAILVSNACNVGCGLDLKISDLEIQLEILRPSSVDDTVLLQNCSCQKSIF